MTEAGWLTSGEPDPMLQFLGDAASERALRLFGCACCRGIWHMLTDERSRTAVELAERFADEQAIPEENRGAYNRAWEVAHELSSPDASQLCNVGWFAAFYAAIAASWTASREPSVCREMTIAAMKEARATSDDPEQDIVRPEKQRQSILLRDIFGNPFRPIAVDPRWLTSNVVDLGRTIYEERAFDRLPILADALIDAGCADDSLLGHCRGPGPHVRGCWVVDLLLGKK
jgi:hypothetical protein